MAKSLNLKALLTLDAKQFQQGMGKIQQQIGTIGNAMKQAFAVGSVAMLGKSILMATKNYEDAMARVQAVSNASAGDMKMMNDEALRLGATTRYTATQVAETLEVLTRNGFNAQKATKSLAATLQLAQSNAVGLADAGNMITNTLNMFGLGVDQVQRVNDVMSSIASNTATNLQDFYDALVNASPMAHALGISIEETAAALGALAQRGIKGADAGTQLRMSLQKMVDPSSMKKLKELGIEIDENVIKTEQLSGVLKKLSEANLSVSQLNEIFTVRSSKSVLQLVNSVDDFNAILEITKASSGTAMRMFEQGVGSVRKELDVLRSVWENLMITWGNATKGPILSVIKGLQNTVNAFKSFGGAASNVLAAIALGFTSKIGNLAGGFQTIHNWIHKTALDLKLQAVESEKATAKLIANNTGYCESVRQTATKNIAARNAEITAIKRQQAAVANLANTFRALAASAAWMAVVIAVQQVIAKMAALNAEFKNAKKAMDNVDGEIEKINREIGTLIKLMGDGNDTNTIAGAVKRATELFPEFADAITQAYIAAGKTKKYQELRDVLNEISLLQENIARANAAEGLINASKLKLGKSLINSTKFFNLSGNDAPNYQKQAKEIAKAIENAGYTGKGEKDVILQRIADVIIDNVDSKISAIKAVEEELKGWEVKGVPYSTISKMVNEMWKGRKMGVFNPIYLENGIRQGQRATSVYKTNTAAADRRRSEMKWDSQLELFLNDWTKIANQYGTTSKEYYRVMGERVQQFVDAVKDITLTKEQENELKGYQQQFPYKETPTKASIGDAGSGSHKKTDWEKFTDTLDEYPKKLQELENQLHNNAITQAEYDKEVTKLNLDTWKAIAAISNLDEKMKSLSKERVETIQTVKAKVPHDAEVANSYRDLIDALHNFNDKKIEIENKKQAGGFETAEDYMEELTKLENETYNTISSFKQLGTAVGLLSDPLKTLYNDVTNAANANKDFAQELKNLKVEAIVITPDFKGMDAEEVKQKRSDYQELVKILSNYITERKKLDFQRDKGAITKEQYDKNLITLNTVAGLTTGSLRNLNEIAEKLPETFKTAFDAIKNFKPEPVQTEDIKVDEQSVMDVFDRYQKKAYELLQQHMNGLLSDDEFNRKMDKLVMETITSTKNFESLNSVVKLLPQAYQDVYNELMSLKEQIENSANGVKNDEPDRNDTKVPDNVDYYKKEPEVKVTVEVKADDITGGTTTQTASTQTAERQESANEELLKRIKEYNKLVEKANKGKKQVELEAEFDKENLEMSLEIKLEKVDELKNYIAELLANEDSYDAVGALTDAAKQKLQELEEEFKKAIEESEILGEKVKLAGGLVQLKSDIDDFSKSAVDNISNVASAFDRLMDAIESIAEAFGKELEWEGLKKVMSVINATIQVMEALKSIILTVQAVKEATTKKNVLNAGKEVVANTAVAASEKVKASAEAKSAAAGAGNAVANIPYVGPILAVASIAAVVAALMAGMNKFAEGGILNGSSSRGDKQIYRGNKGEMVINKAQQGSLYRAISEGRLGGGGSVEFVIRGEQLVGVMKNYNRKWNR